MYCHMSYVRKYHMSSNVQKCDFVSNFEILYIYVCFVYVEGPKADELSLIGFTLVK